ncbi:MAG: hypothetical protein J5973_08615 [Eubacterium sp.]|nr:hypothetical protein [Eubacterium sp.]
MLRFDNRVRLNFEQKVLPCMFYCEYDREHFEERFLKEGAIFCMLDRFYKANEEENPYKADQIHAEKIRIDAEVFCIRVTMPPTDHPSASECILMLYNREFDRLAYYLVEHGWSDRWIGKVKLEFCDEFIPVNDYVKADWSEQLGIVLTDYDPGFVFYTAGTKGEGNHENQTDQDY